MQIRNLFAVLVLLALLTPAANSQAITFLGAIAAGSAGAILCEGLVTSHMEETPESDEPWYLIHHHVGPEDIASFTAGTLCAIPAAAVGGAIGAMVEGSTVATVTTAKGVKHLYKRSPAPKYVEVATETSKDLFSKARKSIAKTTSAWTISTPQYFGKYKGWKTATPSHLRKHMPQLYNRQNGRDALCDVPLPSLYIGPLWNRRLNPAIEVDHALPRAWGGSNDLSNLQLTRKEYNRAKGTRAGIFLENAKKQFCPI